MERVGTSPFKYRAARGPGKYQGMKFFLLKCAEQIFKYGSQKGAGTCLEYERLAKF
jgi:hypothetical protein